MIVECIENNKDKKGNKECPNLTLGEVYYAIKYPNKGVFKHGVYLEGDDGTKGWYSKHRFKVLRSE